MLRSASVSRNFEGWALPGRAVGVILLFAAAAKSYNLTWRGELGEAGTIILIGIEGLVGTWLMWGGRWKQARVASIFLFLCFLVAAFYQWQLGSKNCGCFGPIKSHPGISIVLDIMMLVALVATKRPPRIRLNPYIILAVSLSGAVLAIGVTRAKGGLYGENRENYIRTSKWGGFGEGGLGDGAVLKFIDIQDQLQAGRWRVLIYRGTCPDCAEIIDWLRTPAGVHRVAEDESRLALVEVSEKGRISDGQDLDLYVRGTLGVRNGETIVTPLLISLNDGQVTAIDGSERVLSILEGK